MFVSSLWMDAIVSCLFFVSSNKELASSLWEASSSISRSSKAIMWVFNPSTFDNFFSRASNCLFQTNYPFWLALSSLGWPSLEITVSCKVSISLILHSSNSMCTYYSLIWDMAALSFVGSPSELDSTA